MKKDDVLSVYQEMCELIAISVWQKLEDNKKSNPGFNSQNPIHSKKALKELSIYDIKTKFLSGKGLRLEWGSPN